MRVVKIYFVIKVCFVDLPQVVSALGPRFGEEGSSSEVVDFKGVQSVIEAAEAFLAPGDGSTLSAGDEEKSLIVPRDGSSGERGPGGEPGCGCPAQSNTGTTVVFSLHCV